MKNCNCKQSNCGCDNGLLKLIAIDISQLKNAIEDLENSDRNFYWNNILNKPDVFPPSYHNHSISEITGLNDILNTIENKVDKIEGKSLVEDNEILKLKDLKTQSEIDQSITDAAWATITESIPTIQGGATAATATVLPTLGSFNKWFDASPGFWKYNNIVLKNPLGTEGVLEGNEGKLYWNGTTQTWSISKVQELPQVQSVPNLTTNDDTKALAASQGVILDGRTMVADNQIALLKSIPNTYLSNGIGGISTFNNYALQVYSVSPGDKIRVSSSVTLNLAACIFSFFNSDTPGTSSFVSAGNPTSPFYGTVTKPWTSEIQTVPVGATHLAISNFQGYAITVNKVEDVSTYAKKLAVRTDALNVKVDQLENQVLPNLADSQVVKMVGENLYLGVKYDATNDLLIQFKKSMFNELMTFSRVGLAPNTGLLPSKDVDRTPTTVMNVADSDNIGPINLTSGSWTSGNHSYMNQGVFKTANTVSFEFFADGVKLKDGDLVRCKRVEVKVKNKIKDTGKPTMSGGTVSSLDVDFCDEDVVYVVEKGSISVALSHKYLEGTAVGITTYYGMQSVFIGETQVLTANGAYKNFTAKASVANFNKVDYPNFNRFIEKNTANNTYQVSYLNNGYGIGNHNKILSSDFIFVYSSDKCYHRLLANQNVISPEINSWSGMYSWNKPIQDDVNLLVTTGTYNGEDYIFIDAKGAYNGYVAIPSQFSMREFEVVENYGTATLGAFIEVYGISFNISSAGSVVLKIK